MTRRSANQQFFYFATAILVVAVALCVERTAAREGSAVRDQTERLGRGRRRQPSRTEEKSLRRLREGTLISNQDGFFREDGDGATFMADTGMEFGALPNLNLERVVRLLKSADDPDSIRWSVNGKVTEFAGRNYLLVSRAVYKSVSPPPVPDRIEQEP